jgi:hypothetical protein
MPDQLTTNGDALRLFFTDDFYLVNEPSIIWGLPQEEQLPINKVSEQASPIAVIEAVELKPQLNFQFLGGNKRNILILVNDKDHDVSDDPGKELLRKIVKSINLVTADFALLNYAKYQGASFEDFKGYFNSSLVFSFGVAAAEMGLIDHPMHSVVSEGNVRLIFSHELRKLDADIILKKSLWGILQKLTI